MASDSPMCCRALHGALPRLEPCAVKVARTVLRGRGGGNVASLPDRFPLSAPSKESMRMEINNLKIGHNLRIGLSQNAVRHLACRIQKSGTIKVTCLVAPLTMMAAIYLCYRRDSIRLIVGFSYYGVNISSRHSDKNAPPKPTIEAALWIASEL